MKKIIQTMVTDKCIVIRGIQKMITDMHIIKKVFNAIFSFCENKSIYLVIYLEAITLVF